MLWFRRCGKSHALRCAPRADLVATTSLKTILLRRSTAVLPSAWSHPWEPPMVVWFWQHGSGLALVGLRSPQQPPEPTALWRRRRGRRAASGQRGVLCNQRVKARQIFRQNRNVGRSNGRDRLQSPMNSAIQLAQNERCVLLWQNCSTYRTGSLDVLAVAVGRGWFGWAILVGVAGLEPATR